MIIIVSCNNFVNDFKNRMDDIANRLLIVQPCVNYNKHFIEVQLSTMANIKIIFIPALPEYVKGTRPEYYWTNSYEVEKYFRECVTPKCLQNFTELTNLVLQTYQKDKDIIEIVKDLDVKYCATPGFTSDMKCNCLIEDAKYCPYCGRRLSND